MVEVFRTNILKKENAERLIDKLSNYFPENKINSDLDDCDNILRVEGNEVSSGKVKEIVNNAGFECEILV